MFIHKLRPAEFGRFKLSQISFVKYPQWTSFKRNYSKRADNRTHYEVLEIPESASHAEIKAAFVRLSKKLHPDKNVNDPKSHDKFVTLNKAYNVLKKPNSKREYDIILRYGRSNASYGPYSSTSQRENFYSSQYDYMRHDPSFWQPPNKENVNTRENNIKGVKLWLTILAFGLLYCFFSYKVAVWQVKKAHDRQIQMLKDHEEYVSPQHRVRFASRIERNLATMKYNNEMNRKLNEIDRASLD